MNNATADPQFQTDYDALTTGRGLIALTGWSSVTLTGADRAAFLHNFCTNDVKRLQPGEACEAFITDVKGKVLGHCLVTCRPDELVLVTVPGQAARIIEHLDRYLIREDVTLTDTSSARSLGVVTGIKPDELSGVDGVFACEWLAPIRAVLVEGTVSDDMNLTACGPGAFDAVRIEAGFPLYGVDFDQANLPQEIGRDRRAISFTKGCYLGQETVARIDALGHVNRQLVGVRFDGDVAANPPVELRAEDAVVGTTTSIAYSPKLEAPLGLAIVRREAREPGRRLDSTSGPGEVVPLPVSATT